MPKARDVALPFFSSFLGSLQKKREDEQKVRQIFAEALAKKQAESMFPNAEEQANREVLAEANQAGRLRLRPSTRQVSPLQAPSTEENLQRFGEEQDDASSRKMEFLKYLLPRGTYGMTGTVSPVYFDPDSRQWIDTSGNPVKEITRGTPVRTLPMNEDMRRRYAEATRQGQVQGSAPSQATVSTQSSVENLSRLVQRLKIGFPDVQKVEQGPLAVVGGAGRNIASKMASDPQFKAYKGLREAVLGTVANIVSEENGRFTEGDIQRAGGFLPNPQFDSRADAEAKWGLAGERLADVAIVAINRGRREKNLPLLSPEEEQRVLQQISSGFSLTGRRRVGRFLVEEE